jgi:superfamily I DNA and/or RNA helicase
MAKITSTTQEHLDIADIKNNIVILKNGGAAAVLQAYAINFDLLSMQEQDAAIASYSSLLNSLSFPIQVTIRSKKMDITEYLDNLKEFEKKEVNKKIKSQINSYRHFIQEEIVVKEDVLDKQFYITIPYKMISLSDATPLGWMDKLIAGLNLGPKASLNIDKIVQEASVELEPKKNFLIKEFARIGIKTKPLGNAELIKLFYEIYNSETSQNQRIKGNAWDYTSTLVEPKIA